MVTPGEQILCVRKDTGKLLLFRNAPQGRGGGEGRTGRTGCLLPSISGGASDSLMSHTPEKSDFNDSETCLHNPTTQIP